MNSPKVLCAAGAVCLLTHAPLTRAQLGTATITWEANDGSGWTSGVLETTEPSVEVRMKVEWEPSPEVGIAFAANQFDAIITSPTGTIDTVADPQRLGAFRNASAQTLVASRFGDRIKIDDSRDTLPPGSGTRGVFPGQLLGPFGELDLSIPALVFSFRLTFDAIPGSRRVNSLYIAPSGGDTISRYMRLFTSRSGTQNIPTTTTLPLEIVYLPSPAGSTIAVAGALLLTRRRR
jgi:hypothetical protein